jgi:hypothetical protein
VLDAGGSKASLDCRAIPFAHPESILDLSQTSGCPAFGKYAVRRLGSRIPGYVLVIMIAQETIKTVFVADLVPTQMTVGMREVNFKRRRWRERSSREAADYLNRLRIPVVLGPNARQYLIDRHHLTLALYNEGIGELTVSVLANLSMLSFDDFWTSLESQNWTHPYDERGVRRCHNDMPATIDDLQDDPFRSLAGAVKRAGGYGKDDAPFSEFRWADFLRGRIPRELVERDFDRALTMAMHLAQGAEAAALPGWRRFPTE